MRKKDLHPFLLFENYFGNFKFFLNPFIFSNKTVSRQFSSKDSGNTFRAAVFDDKT